MNIRFKRLIAFLIDQYIIAFITFQFVTTLYLFKVLTLPEQSIYLMLFIPMILTVFHDILPVGKKIMKIKVINKKNKKNASLWRKVLRNITMIVPYFDGALAFFSVRIGDRLAQTDVVEK